MQRQLQFVLDDDYLDQFMDDINTEILKNGTGLKLYQDAQRNSDKRIEQQRQKELQEYRQEMSQIRTKPKMNANSRLINEKRGLKVNTGNFYDYNLKWLKNKEKKIELEKEALYHLECIESQKGHKTNIGYPYKNNDSINNYYNKENIMPYENHNTENNQSHEISATVKRKKCPKPESPTFKPVITSMANNLDRIGTVEERLLHWDGKRMKNIQRKQLEKEFEENQKNVCDSRKLVDGCDQMYERGKVYQLRKEKKCLKLQAEIEDRDASVQLYKTPDRILKICGERRRLSQQAKNSEKRSKGTQGDRHSTCCKSLMPTQKKDGMMDQSHKDYTEVDVRNFVNRNKSYLKKKEIDIENIKKEQEDLKDLEQTPVKKTQAKSKQMLKSSKRYEGMNFEQRQQYYQTKKLEKIENQKKAKAEKQEALESDQKFDQVLAENSVERGPLIKPDSNHNKLQRAREKLAKSRPENQYKNEPVKNSNTEISPKSDQKSPKVPVVRRLSSMALEPQVEPMQNKKNLNKNPSDGDIRPLEPEFEQNQKKSKNSIGLQQIAILSEHNSNKFRSAKTRKDSVKRIDDFRNWMQQNSNKKLKSERRSEDPINIMSEKFNIGSMELQHGAEIPYRYATSKRENSKKNRNSIKRPEDFAIEQRGVTPFDERIKQFSRRNSKEKKILSCMEIQDLKNAALKQINNFDEAEKKLDLKLREEDLDKRSDMVDELIDGFNLEEVQDLDTGDNLLTTLKGVYKEDSRDIMCSGGKVPGYSRADGKISDLIVDIKDIINDNEEDFGAKGYGTDVKGIEAYYDKRKSDIANIVDEIIDCKGDGNEKFDNFAQNKKPEKKSKLDEILDKRKEMQKKNNHSPKQRKEYVKKTLDDIIGDKKYFDAVNKRIESRNNSPGKRQISEIVLRVDEHISQSEEDSPLKLEKPNRMFPNFPITPAQKSPKGQNSRNIMANLLNIIDSPVEYNFPQKPDYQDHLDEITESMKDSMPSSSINPIQSNTNSSKNKSKSGLLNKLTNIIDNTNNYNYSVTNSSSQNQPNRPYSRSSYKPNFSNTNQTYSNNPQPNTLSNQNNTNSGIGNRYSKITSENDNRSHTDFNEEYCQGKIDSSWQNEQQFSRNLKSITDDVHSGEYLTGQSILGKTANEVIPRQNLTNQIRSGTDKNKSSSRNDSQSQYNSSKLKVGGQNSDSSRLKKCEDEEVDDDLVVFQFRAVDSKGSDSQKSQVDKNEQKQGKKSGRVDSDRIENFYEKRITEVTDNYSEIDL